MIANEIIIKQSALNLAISTLKGLQNETLSAKMDPDDVLMSTSISETSDAVQEMFTTLQQAEAAFAQLLQNTILAMEAAGVSFAEADAQAGQGFEDIPYTVIL